MRFLRYEGVMVQVLGVGMDKRVVKMRVRFGRTRFGLTRLADGEGADS